MQQNQRFILFILLSMGMYLAFFFLGPKIAPGIFGKPAAKQKQVEKSKTPAGKTAPAKTGERKTAIGNAGKTQPEKTGIAKTGKEPPKIAKKPDDKPKIPDVPQRKFDFHPPRKLVLGSDDPSTGYFLKAVIITRGAAVDSILLNDDRYRTINDRNVQLRVVDVRDYKVATLAMQVSEIDAQLKPFRTSLDSVHWAVVNDKTVAKDGVTTDVTMSFTAPDGLLKLTKRFWLEKVDLDGMSLKTAQDTQSAGYELHIALGFENLDTKPQVVNYKLQGPVGVPLEDRENARVHRGIVIGVQKDDNDPKSVKSTSITAKTLVGDSEEWSGEIRYIGVDVQYFVAMLIPGGPSYLKDAKSVVLEKDREEQYSDISVELTGNELTLAPRGEKNATVTHTYTLFAGPKRKELLEPYQAESIIQYGWFGIIARGMLWLLNFFHSIGLTYGLAIICLTIVVRAGLFPLSRKQAVSAKKMKDLQPKIAELKKKYANDREKMTRAQMELFAKHGYNPLAGCLPLILQLPIFIGLYQALSNAVDLRLAPFPLTWINNLAAPDALFRLPFRLPFLGQDFNLLPLITVVLFIVQQKMFTPPPTDEQSAQMQKIMPWMSAIFGFLFYRVPAGLCIYFIASSLWGMGERKLLDLRGSGPEPEKATGKNPDGSSGPSGDEPPEKPKGFFAKLLDMADDAQQAKARANGGTADKSAKGTPSAGNRKKKGGRKRR